MVLPLGDAVTSTRINPGAYQKRRPRTVRTIASEAVRAARRGQYRAAALGVVADMMGLDVVRLDNLFYVTTTEKAERLRKQHARRPWGPPAVRGGLKIQDVGGAE